MNIIFSRETGWQLANTVSQNFITGTGFQPLIAKETLNAPPIASAYSFTPYIIITNIFV